MPAFLGAALMLVAFLRPDPLQVARAVALASDAATDTEQPAPAGGKRDLAAVRGDRHIPLALLVLALTNLTMVGVMAVAPVHLHAHGAGMGMVGMMIGADIAAIYLPSPVTGWLADRLGGRTVGGVGGLLLGVGWNAGLIGGSALLRDAPVQPTLRTRAEGIGELGMGAAAAAAGGGAGLLLATGGFALLCMVAAAPCLLVVAVVATTGGSRVGSLGGVRWSGSAPTGMSPAFRQRGSR
jgi:hypothetical protein